MIKTDKVQTNYCSSDYSLFSLNFPNSTNTVLFCYVLFYDISTIGSYVMPINSSVPNSSA